MNPWRIGPRAEDFDGADDDGYEYECVSCGACWATDDPRPRVECRTCGGWAEPVGVGS